ncbi:tetratricopeptide repeat protein, partial [bacterium]|nr:tetratricopeptide repeat protein [bacterium]
PDRNIKVNILITLGNVYSQQQKYREAEEALRDALSLNLPNRISIYYALGSNYERQGRLNEAIERFNYMIVNSGSLSIKFAGGAHFHLGCIYKELGKKKEAKHHFEECLKVIPEHKKARENQDALAQAER